jgi:hypothetical protein
MTKRYTNPVNYIYFKHLHGAEDIIEALAKIATLANISDSNRHRFNAEMKQIWATAQLEFKLYSNGRRAVAQKSPLLKLAQALREAKNAAAKLRPEELEQFGHGIEYVLSFSDEAEFYSGLIVNDACSEEVGRDLISILEEALSCAVGREPLRKVRKEGRGRNFGTIENWPLDHLVRDLLYQAELLGEGLEYNKNDGGRSLLDALDLLFPLLPDGFVPGGDWPLDAINNTYRRHRAKRKDILAKKAILQRLEQVVAKKRSSSSFQTG